eukprot:maker-scaffold619_size123246-snap-gene-0.37 protein:Tk05503 transcript:maker-scaffold619_size123246-snap-gene-0.37-mRNA-1 annotation:"dna-directed rna polymerase iii subunit rpc6"
MATTPEASGSVEPPTIKSEANELAERILALCKEIPTGINDKLLQTSMPDVDPKSRALAINHLLTTGKIDLLQSEKGLLYKAKSASSKVGTIKGDAEEKLVYKIIEEAGNKGTWIRDIRIKSNLIQTQLNKALKSLKSKKLIKDVKCVNSTRKIVYMLFNLEPDSSVTGGAWYSDQDFESEFVEILNQQCYRYLYQKLEKSRECTSGPLVARNISQASSKEVLQYISELGISKVQLRVEDIEAILDTLIFDGKVEKTMALAEGEETRLFRAVESLLPVTGLMRMPCGGCPVIKECGDVGSVNPIKCSYMTEWLT